LKKRLFIQATIQRGVLIPVFTAADIPEHMMAMTVQVLVGVEVF